MRRFLAMIVCSVAVIGYVAYAQATPFRMEVPAANMKTRADIVRRDFVETHLVPANAYPLAKAFHSASMLPTDRDIGRQLLERGDGVFAIRRSGERRATLTNQGSRILNPQFLALLEDRNLRTVVSVPQRMELVAEWTETTLTITPTTSLVVTFRDLPTVAGVPIPIDVRQQIDRVTVSDRAVILQTHGLGRDRKAFELVLNLERRANAINNSIAGARLLALSILHGRYLRPPFN